MWQFDESAAQLPPPRAEEPANLRREIVEELSDHLTCARRREQMASDEQNEVAVRRRVLDRFGDPAAVARKLWLDWMWERIMTQRILVATCVLMAVISCVAIGLAWASFNRQQDMMATWQSTSETQMRDQRQLFERLLAQSEKALTQGAKAQPSIEWNPMELRFVTGKKDGPAVAGVRVSLSHRADNSAIPSMDGTSDERGMVRFERVHYGDYTLRVTTPWNEYDIIWVTQRPGESLTKTIICAERTAQPSQVNAQIEWPDELADKPLWFRFSPNAVYRQLEDRIWRYPELLAGGYSESVLIEPSGAMHRMKYRDAQPISQASSYRSMSRGRRGRASARELSSLEQLSLPILSWDYFAGSEVNEVSKGIMWLDNGYKIRELDIMVPIPKVATMDDLRRQELPYGPDGFGQSRPFPQLLSQGKFFFAIHLSSAEWSHRVEPATSDKPGVLWLTPTADAVEKVRATLVQSDTARAAVEKAQAELEKSRAEAEQQRDSTGAPDAEKKDSTDST